MAASVNFSFSFKPCRSISGWVIFTELFKARRSVSIHKNIQTATFANNTLESNNQNNYILTVQ